MVVDWKQVGRRALLYSVFPVAIGALAVTAVNTISALNTNSTRLAENINAVAEGRNRVDEEQSGRITNVESQLGSLGQRVSGIEVLLTPTATAIHEPITIPTPTPYAPVTPATTPTITSKPQPTPTATATLVPTATPTAVATPTATPTATPIATPTPVDELVNYFNALTARASQGQTVGMTFYNDPATSCFKTVAYSIVRDSAGKVVPQESRSRTFTFSKLETLASLAQLVGVSTVQQVPVSRTPSTECANVNAYNRPSTDVFGQQFVNLLQQKLQQIVSVIRSEGKYGTSR